MGKKNKKKGGGAEKTLAKTLKKQQKKGKNKQQDDEDEDLDALLAEFKQAETLAIVPLTEPPHARVNGSWTAHPSRDEILLFGGEFFDGAQNTTYSNLLAYNIKQSTWREIKAPGAPPPRNSQQAAFIGNNDLYVFGGEYTLRNTFRHYKDLWKLDTHEWVWSEVKFKGSGPSARSGHRMVSYKKKLYIFGGFHDDGIAVKYFNSLHVYDSTTNRFAEAKYGAQDPIPAARSGFQFVLDEPKGKAYLFGGVSSAHALGKKGELKNTTYDDIWSLELSSCKWTKLKIKCPVKKTGVTMVCGKTGVFAFGGSQDSETELDITSQFSGALELFHLGKKTWNAVELMDPRDVPVDQPDSEEDDDAIILSSDEEGDEAPVAKMEKKVDVYAEPCPRRNGMMCLKKNRLYLFGGAFEDDKGREITLGDLHSLDVRKTSAWRQLIAPSEDVTWKGSDDDDDLHGEEDDEEEEDEEKTEAKMNETPAQIFDRTKQEWLDQVAETPEYATMVSEEPNEAKRNKLHRKMAFALFMKNTPRD